MPSSTTPGRTQNSFEPGATFALRVALTEFGIPLLGGQVQAEVHHPDGTPEQLPCSDCPAFQRLQTSPFSIAESPNRCPGLMPTPPLHRRLTSDGVASTCRMHRVNQARGIVGFCCANAIGTALMKYRGAYSIFGRSCT